MEREYQVDLPPIPCSMGQIQQVLLNPLGNAAHAMAVRHREAPPAKLILRSAPEGNMACIGVEDNGPGIDETTPRRIFEPSSPPRRPEKAPGLACRFPTASSWTTTGEPSASFPLTGKEPASSSDFPSRLTRLRP